jgi:hypothetical protein
MDGYLASNLNVTLEALKDDWDFCFVVDGPERSGKSALAQQMAAYVDPSFPIYGLERIAWTFEDFKNIVNNAKDGQAIIFDEAQQLSSRSALSRINKEAVALMAAIGQKHLYSFFCLPAFFELEKYIAVWRSTALISVYIKRPFIRGFFKFYGYEKKKHIYFTGKKTFSYTKYRDFAGRFSKGYAVDELKYRELKLKSLSACEPSSENRFKTERDAMIRYLIDVKGWSQGQVLGSLSEFLPKNRQFSQQMVAKVMSELRNKDKRNQRFTHE